MHTVSTLPHTLNLPGLELKQWQSLDAQTIEELCFYAEEGFEDFNQQLRANYSLRDPKHVKMNNALTRAARPLTQGALLYRSGIFSKNFLDRTDWTDPAWVSTSMIEFCALAHLEQEQETFARLMQKGYQPVLMKLYVAEQIRAVPLAAILHMRSYIDGTAEREVTLERNLKYHVMSQEKTADYLLLEVAVTK